MLMAVFTVTVWVLRGIVLMVMVMFMVMVVVMGMVMIMVLVVIMVVVMIMVMLVVMLMIMVMVMVVNICVAVVLLLQAEGHRGLVPGRHVVPVLLLQLPSGLVPLRLNPSQSSTDKLLLHYKQCII